MNGANLTVEEQIAIVAQMRKYFQKHIPLGDFIACLAEKNGQVASACRACDAGDRGVDRGMSSIRSFRDRFERD